MEQVITARGHEAVSGTHESTLEVTTDTFLTPAGDCIVGIEADTAPAAFDDVFVTACKDENATIHATFEVTGLTETVIGRGDPSLTFEDDRGAVLRTSSYIDDRTVMVEADTAAADLDRGLIDALQDGATLTVTLSVLP